MLENTTSEFIQESKPAAINYFEKKDEAKEKIPAESSEAAQSGPSLSEIKARQDALDLKKLSGLAGKKRENMTFKEREARKRRRGQVSRNGAGGSYVENEKRLLREMNKSDSVRL
mmetsp:Transcript_37015/g.71409  ORF Transcript_37015/g.71409 Transcript_37015/m.71409 type:complete len:115 (+) Transcript_37015:158-502(+)